MWAHYAALKLGVMYAMSQDDDGLLRTSEELRRVADVHLNLVSELCEKFPGQTKTVAPGVADVRRMLNDCTTKRDAHGR